MKTAYFYRNYKTVLVVLSLLFFLVSFIFHELPDFSIYRAIRGIICLSFLLLLFLCHKKELQPLLGTFLFLYGASSLATIWYEDNVVAIVSMLLNFLSYLALVRALFPKVDFKKMNLSFTIIFFFMMLINGYLIYQLVDTIKDMTLSNLHYIIIMISTMTLFLVGFLALLYNYKYSTKATLVFSFFVFLIVFSEVFRAIAYYELAYGDVAVYVARALLILGLCVLVHYSFVEKKEDERLNRNVF